MFLSKDTNNSKLYVIGSSCPSFLGDLIETVTYYETLDEDDPDDFEAGNVF